MNKRKLYINKGLGNGRCASVSLQNADLDCIIHHHCLEEPDNKVHLHGDQVYDLYYTLGELIEEYGSEKRFKELEQKARKTLEVLESEEFQTRFVLDEDLRLEYRDDDYDDGELEAEYNKIFNVVSFLYLLRKTMQGKQDIYHFIKNPEVREEIKKDVRIPWSYLIEYFIHSEYGMVIVNE